MGTVVLHLEFASRVRVRGQNFLKGAFGGPSASGGLRPGYPLAVQLLPPGPLAVRRLIDDVVLIDRPFFFRRCFLLRGSLFLTPAIKIHRTGVVEMSFPSGARAAVGLPSVPPQRLIRNDCSSRDTRSRGCTANLRHKIAKGAVAQDSEHIRSCTLSH